MSSNKYITSIEKIINDKFHKKYYIDENIYNIIKIENLLYCDKTHLVSEFKDLMILNEIFEFLSKLYPLTQSASLLKKMINYYEKNCFLFPNYARLQESKYLYNNIHNKQRILNEQATKIENISDEAEKNKENEDKKIFDNSVYNSIMKESDFSIFDIRKHNEKLDSSFEINKLITEIEKNNCKKINNFNLIKDNTLDNNNKEEEERKNIKINIINKNNFFYKKSPQKGRTNFIINKKNNINQMKKIENNFSSIYIKSKINQKLLNKRIQINNKTDEFSSFLKRKNDSLLTLLDSSKYKIELFKNNSGSKNIYVYNKYSPFNKVSKCSFCINKKDKSFKNESLKSIKIKKCNNIKLNGSKKDNLYIEVFSYVNKPNNIINYTIKNQYFNGTKDSIENKTSNDKLNKDSIISGKINTEYKNENQNKNYFNLFSKVNNVNIFNNTTVNEENLNINDTKTLRTKLKNKFLTLNKKKSLLSKEKNVLNKTTKKSKNVNNIITSIRNKMKKENKFKISQIILQLIKNKRESSKTNEKNLKTELNKNIISFKKLVQLHKKRNNQKSNLKNKLLLSLENSNSQKFNKFSMLKKSNFNQSSTFLHKNQLNTPKRRNFKNIIINPLTMPSFVSQISHKNISYTNTLTIKTNRIHHPTYKEEKEHNNKMDFRNKSNTLLKTLNSLKDLNIKKSSKKTDNIISVEKKGSFKLTNYKTIGPSTKNGCILIDVKNRKNNKILNIKRKYTSTFNYKKLKK